MPAWRRLPTHNYSFQRDSSEFYGKMCFYLSCCIEMTKRSGEYSAVNCQLLLGNLIVDFLCCIFWDLLYLVIRKCLCIVRTYFRILNKTMTKKKYSKKLIKSKIKPKNLGICKERFILTSIFSEFC